MAADGVLCSSPAEHTLDTGLHDVAERLQELAARDEFGGAHRNCEAVAFHGHEGLRKIPLTDSAVIRAREQGSASVVEHVQATNPVGVAAQNLHKLQDARGGMHAHGRR